MTDDDTRRALLKELAAIESAVGEIEESFGPNRNCLTTRERVQTVRASILQQMYTLLVGPGDTIH